MAELGKCLCQVKEYYPLLYCHEVDFKPLCPFVHKVDICSPGMKQNCEKMQTNRIFSWRGCPSWVKFLYKVKKCCPLLCCPEVDFQPLSPFAHKMDICSPGMKQNCEKCWLSEIYHEEDGWAGEIFYARLKSTIRCFIAIRSILSPCFHLSIKRTFVHLEWSKIMKKYRLSEFFLEEDGQAG